MRISDWSSDVCSSDLRAVLNAAAMLPKVSQGVTTVVVGNCGISLSPSPVARGGEPIPPLNLLGGREVFGFPRFADYRRRVEEQIGRASCRERVCQYV